MNCTQTPVDYLRCLPPKGMWSVPSPVLLWHVCTVIAVTLRWMFCSCIFCKNKPCWEILPLSRCSARFYSKSPHNSCGYKKHPQATDDRCIQWHHASLASLCCLLPWWWWWPRCLQMNPHQLTVWTVWMVDGGCALFFVRVSLWLFSCVFCGWWVCACSCFLWCLCEFTHCMCISEVYLNLFVSALGCLLYGGEIVSLNWSQIAKKFKVLRSNINLKQQNSIY